MKLEKFNMTRDQLIAKLNTLEDQNAELLDALKAVFEVFDDDYSHGIAKGYWEDYKDIQKQATQAIAKAEGDA